MKVYTSALDDKHTSQEGSVMGSRGKIAAMLVKAQAKLQRRQAVVSRQQARVVALTNAMTCMPIDPECRHYSQFVDNNGNHICNSCGEFVVEDQ